jgi:hypothetical protein
MKLKGKIIGLGMLGLTKADMRDAGRAGMKLAGWLWHRRFKPLHFLPNAGPKYGYTVRSRLYRNAQEAFGKRRTPGPIRPLVFTGQSESLALASNTVRARATGYTRYHADVIINAPALNYKNQNSSIDMRKEVTTLLPSETKAIEREFVRGYVKTVDQIIATKRATRRLAG